jgi:hypothetical protein
MIRRIVQHMRAVFRHMLEIAADVEFADRPSDSESREFGRPRMTQQARSWPPTSHPIQGKGAGQEWADDG